ncbi:MAG TPA: iron-sulfur cluster assembly accessory protein [Thermoanaerobaculia bacterium]|nr:iron-sulfur cluster assembly accessory protein [Thermoanaerobaculia bacterium]
MTISLSPEAASHLASESAGRLLRVAFTTGCGGSGYRLGFADAPNEGDRVIEIGGLRLALDDMAASRLDGAVITYDEEGGGYLLDHPDAVTAVWCG